MNVPSSNRNGSGKDRNKSQDQEQELIKKMRSWFSFSSNIIHPAINKNKDVSIGDDTAFLSKETFLRLLQKPTKENKKLDFFFNKGSDNSRNKNQNNYHKLLLSQENPSGMLFTTDTLVEDIHFCWNWSTPREVARKLMEMNTSDIYAKGGVPSFAFLNLSLSAFSLQKRMPSFLPALAKVAREHGVSILGGDTTAAGKDVFTLTLIGTAGRRFIGRCPTADNKRGLQAKDLLVIMGEPGWSGYALEMLVQNKSLAASVKKKHTAPRSCPQALEWLFALETLVSIDQSDSFFQTLQILSLQNNISLRVNLEKIPSVKKLKKISRDHIRYVLSSGEDFSIVAIIPQEKKDAALQYQKKQKNFSIIGEVDEVFFAQSATTDVSDMANIQNLSQNPQENSRQNFSQYFSKKKTNSRKLTLSITPQNALIFYQDKKRIFVDEADLHIYRHFD